MPFVRAGRPGLLGTVGRTAVIAGTASMTANAIGRRSAGRARAQQQAAAAQATQQAPPPPPQAPPAPAAPGGDDLVERITELAKLRDAGALTDAELATAKAELLEAWAARAPAGPLCQPAVRDGSSRQSPAGRASCARRRPAGSTTRRLDYSSSVGCSDRAR